MTPRIFTPLALSLALTAAPAFALDLSDATQFSLNLTHQEPELRIEGGLRTTLDIDTIEIKVRESGPGPTYLEMTLGNLFVIDHHGAASAVDLRGHTLAFGFGARQALTELIYVSGALEARYNDVDSRVPQHTLRWRQGTARIQAGLNTSMTDTYVCGGYINIDGDRLQNNTYQNIDTLTHNYYCGGMRLNVEDDGYIGIEFSSDPINTSILYFGKYF